MRRYLPFLLCFLFPFLVASGDANAEVQSKRLTVLADSFAPDTLQAVRAETRVRGMELEEMATSSLAPDVLIALAERPDVIAVLYQARGLGSDGLWAVTGKDQQAHATIPEGAEGRAIAAIAHSLVDDLVSASRVTVDVHVNVNVDGNARATGQPPATIAAVPAVAPAVSNWSLDVGGLVASSEVWAAHAGFLRTIRPSVRLGFRGTIAEIPNDGFAAAVSVNVSKVWTGPLRLEVGARGLYTRVWDSWDACEEGLLTAFYNPCDQAQSGMGVGVFAGAGHSVGPATFYLRVGADLVAFPGDAPIVAPNGGLGVELAL